ncbi:ABC transporter permease subunit [Rhodanobacter sp. MP1X3]|jgi:sn-glycerol 3-phosphate transport system permease protein|uniref:ABC transporter permease subunit n=1 Tax=Rhodanobacter sp. MP1X3 TaxID=2723086 RepID=UPI00161B7E7A|nr:ABC transporter permease subunit [Rhodanobacter sp. MP1X3]MBB6242887.1 sn-glycerol 3-phosphate transport system permease protein [Rhodanobacter sp. MP1X3]
MVERHPLLKTTILILLVVGLVFALGPIYLALCSASVTSRQILVHGLALLPGRHLWENLRIVLRDAHIGTMLFNSCVVSLIVVTGKLALASTSAFAAVYFRSRIRHVVFWGTFVTLLLPLEVRIVPTYAVASDLFEPLRRLIAAVTGLHLSVSINLLDSYAGLSLPLMASATGTFLFRQFYLTVPTELSEAARMDGAGPIRFFIDILLPLSKANFAALGTIVFLGTWKDYMWPLVATSRPDMRTISLGIATFLPTETGQPPEWNLVMAAALIALAPPLFVMGVTQRWFVRGVTGIGK